ncbi:MAG: alpha/beta hydrolase [Terriglobales bacterium]
MNRLHAAFVGLLICAMANVALAQLRPNASAIPLGTAAPTPAARDVSFHSASLGRSMKYRILLPAGYDRGARHYPVLYLLHGLGGDYTNWDSRTRLREYVAGMALIVVMPDADDSWYVNSVAEPQNRFEDYIVKDLVTEIDTKYRTIATRKARAIAGLSMGGYGSVKIALKYSNLFVFAGSLSGTLDVAHEDHKPRAGEKYHQLLLAILGPAGGATWLANDVFALAGGQHPAGFPYFWISCGTDDFLLESNRQFTAALQQRKIPYTYIEAPGGHSWALWDEELPAMLREMSRHVDVDKH